MMPYQKVNPIRIKSPYKNLYRERNGLFRQKENMDTLSFGFFITTAYTNGAQAGLGRLYLVEDNGSKSVIRIKAVNKHLEVDSTAYWAEEILPERADSNFVDRTISIEQIKNELPEFGLLLGSKWIKDNDINKDAIPHELIFYEDGSFYAYYYRNPPCDFKGRWYISSLQPTTGEINLTIKAQNITCDLRGYTEYGMSDHSYTITNTRLGRSNTSFDYNGYQDYHRN